MFLPTITQKQNSFKGKIIDAHVHTGEWTRDVFKCDDVLKLINTKLNNGKDYVDKVIISNLSCIKTDKNMTPIKNELIGNYELLEECKKHKQLVPLLVCQPKYGSAENIEYLINRYPNIVKGLKFHPACLNLKANDSRYFPYMEVASKYKLPCLFHSEVLNDNMGNVIRGGVSEPEFIYETAKKFPDVPVILGHMGLGSGKANEIAVDTMLKSIE